MSVLSRLDNFVSEQNIPRLINREFRDLLIAARPYNNLFEDFRQNVVDNEDTIIDEVLKCNFSQCPISCFKLTFILCSLRIVTVS